MAFLNTADIGVCTLLESNYATIRDEYSSFKTEYLYNESRENFDVDDTPIWEVWKEGHDSALDSAKRNEVYSNENWDDHTIIPLKKSPNWYGLSVDDLEIWEGILLASRVTTPFTLTPTPVCDRWFPQTLSVLKGHKNDVITSATIAVFQQIELCRGIMDTQLLLEFIYHCMFHQVILDSLLGKRQNLGKQENV